MANVIDSFDIKATRVPFVIPLAITSALGIAQIFLGVDPLILLLCMAGILVTCLPLCFNGRDLYSIFALWLMLNWIGFPLIIKTLYGQPLQSHLYDPLAAYAWGLVLMIVYTAVFMLVRFFDNGVQRFPLPTDPRSLRRISIPCFFIGVASIAMIHGQGDDGGEIGGAGFVLASTQYLMVLAIIAEAMRNLQISGKLFGPVLIAMLGGIFLVITALNARGFFLNCVIGVFLIAFIYRAIKIQYFVVGVVFAAIFLNFISPVVLYMREYRKIGTARFIELTVQTAWRAASDPDFRRFVKDRTEGQKYTVVDEQFYDYYGDRSNVANRVSLIAQFDRVITAARSIEPLRFAGMRDAMSRVPPRFFGFFKAPEATGDWIAWNLGIEEYGAQSYLAFALASEAYATWGWIGPIVYPFLFVFPFLFAYSKFASFRSPAPASILCYCIVAGELIETCSDSFWAPFFRNIPIQACILFALYYVYNRARREPDLAAAPAEA